MFGKAWAAGDIFHDYGENGGGASGGKSSGFRDGDNEGRGCFECGQKGHMSCECTRKGFNN